MATMRLTYKRPPAPKKRLMALTSEQERRVAEWREEWLRAGMDTGPADRPRAEAAVRAMCARVGVDCPPIVWCNGPATMVLTYYLLRQLDASLGASLDASLGASLGASLRDSLDASLGASLDSEIINEILWWWRWRFSGQHSLAWWAHYAYCRDELGVDIGADQSRDLDLWLEVGRSCGWWRPRDGIIWICERPLSQTLDEDGRLHNDSAPAILCRDSWAVWAVHGVRVTRQVVEAPETLTVEQILGEKNTEVRRVMIERFGAERLIAEGDAELLDEVHEPPFPGLIDAKLYRLPVTDDEPLMMVKCRNSTPEPDGSYKPYWLRIHPECSPIRNGEVVGPPQELTALNALASTWGERGENYQPSVET
jgi:hypothetical protein